MSNTHKIHHARPVSHIHPTPHARDHTSHSHRHDHDSHDHVHLSDEARDHHSKHGPVHPVAKAIRHHGKSQSDVTSLGTGAVDAHEAATSATSSLHTLTRHSGHVMGAIGTALGQIHDHVKGDPVRSATPADDSPDGFAKYAGPAGLASSALGIGHAISQLMHGHTESGATGLASSTGGALASGTDTIGAYKGGLLKLGSKAADLAGRSKLLGKAADLVGKVGDSAKLLGKVGGIAGGVGALIDGGTTIAQGAKDGNKDTMATGAVKSVGGALMLGGVPLDECGIGEAMQAAGGLVYAGASVWQSRHAIGHFFSQGAHDVSHWASTGWHDTTSFLSSLNPF